MKISFIFFWVLPTCTLLVLVLPSFTEFYLVHEWALLGFTRFFFGLSSFYRVLPSFT